MYPLFVGVDGATVAIISLLLFQLRQLSKLRNYNIIFIQKLPRSHIVLLNLSFAG